jgi:5'-nucleotidase
VRLVLTNDDGVDAAGLHALARACAALGHDFVVAAPSTDLSGSSAAIGRIRSDTRVGLQRVVLPAQPGVEAYAVDGPPGLAALAASLGGFGARPDLLLSGINVGANAGRSILHSGTVGAALTAASFGLSGIAFSAEVGDPMPWPLAAAFLETALALVDGAPAGTVLNVNVPARTAGDVRGWRWARLDRFGTVRVAVASASDEWLQMEYHASDAELEPDSDTALLADGWVTVTAIEAINEVPLYGRTPSPDVAGRLTEVPETKHPVARLPVHVASHGSVVAPESGESAPARTPRGPTAGRRR